MPWFWIIILLGGVFIVGIIVQGIYGFLSWSNERRVCAQLKKQAKERRRQSHHGNSSSPSPPS
jgi:FtsZ-interacting cell division protein ZipA